MSATMDQTARQAIPGPDDIIRVELDNGITILSRANPTSGSVVIQGYLPAGSLFDSDEKLGLADFVASSLMRGTGQRDFQTIYDDLESAGASLGFSGGTHTAGFSGKALVEDLELLLALANEALRQPAFPEEQIERLRAQMLTGLAMRAQDTGSMSSLAFDKLVYPDHPYSRPDDGYPETIQAIGVDDLHTFHKKHYGPQGMVLSIVGGIDTDDVVDKVKATLGDWSNPDQPPVPELPPTKTLQNQVEKRVDIPGKSQSDLVMGTIGPARKSPDFLAASVGNNILGRFGLMGRIGDVVREQAGLAYYAYSSVSGGIGPAPWTVTAGVDPSNEQKAADLIKQEVKRFVTEKVTEEELSDSQANYIGRLPLSLESNGGVAGALLNLERHKLGLDYYRQYPDLINAITREDVLAAAANYLDPDRLAIAIAGPTKE
ncbi:MAG: insulinase family protein [Chloroflexi bacterium]|nr:MAG: insulinase family protein [Chloroflexota bacterium]MBL1194562.1 insulinase family protein [Chloroflexota bacterium]NOH11850.1 insulinase family protein [Chloroflexota bacterium]